MTNRYLEKAASLYDFFNDLTGKEHSDLKARKYHLERAIANKDTIESLSQKIKLSGARTYRARAATAGGLAATAAVGLYGAKKYTDNQNEKARQNLYAALEMQKQAGLLRKLIPVTSRFAAVAKSATNSALDIVNTAHGGKVKEFAHQKFGGETPDFKKFLGKKKKEQDYMMFKNFGRDAKSNLRNLRTKQRAAQIGVYGTAAGTAYAYSKGKTKGRNEAYGY